MNHAKSKLKQDIYACLSRLNVLVREFSYEDEQGATEKVSEAVKRIAGALGTTAEQIRTRSSEAHIVLPRQICQYVIRTTLNATYKDIAAATGLDDHTCIIHSCRKIERMREANEEFDKKVRKLCGMFLDRPNSQEGAA